MPGEHRPAANAVCSYSWNRGTVEQISGQRTATPKECFLAKPGESDRTCGIELLVIFEHWFLLRWHVFILLLEDCFGFFGIELAGDAIGPITLPTIVAGATGMEDLNEVGKAHGFAKNEQ